MFPPCPFEGRERERKKKEMESDPMSVDTSGSFDDSSSSSASEKPTSKKKVISISDESTPRIPHVPAPSKVISISDSSSGGRGEATDPYKLLFVEPDEWDTKYFPQLDNNPKWEDCYVCRKLGEGYATIILHVPTGEVVAAALWDSTTMEPESDDSDDEDYAVAFIDAIGTRTDHRGKGLARRLVDDFIRLYETVIVPMSENDPFWKEMNFHSLYSEGDADVAKHIRELLKSTYFTIGANDSRIWFKQNKKRKIRTQEEMEALKRAAREAEERDKKIRDILAQMRRLLRVQEPDAADEEIALDRSMNNRVNEYAPDDPQLVNMMEACKEYNKETEMGTPKPLQGWKKLVKMELITETMDVQLIEVLACALGIFPYNYDLHDDNAVRGVLMGTIIAAMDTSLRPSKISVSRFVAIGKKKSAEGFYSMKNAQGLDDLKISLPGVDEDACPLMDKYSVVAKIGGGTYGTVFRVSVGKDDSQKTGIKTYALKVQPIERPEEASESIYQELRIVETVMRRIRTPDFNSRLVNVTKLYDWVKCTADLGVSFKGKISDSAWDSVFKNPEKDWSGEQTWQFMIFEYLHGDMSDILTNSASVAFSGDFLRAFLTQIFCTLSQLQDTLRFVHFDFHTGNILFQDMRHGGATPPKYIKYTVRGKTFYVPTEDSRSKLFKISDYGFSFIKFYEDKEWTPRIFASAGWYVSGESRANRFNPRQDLHKLACSLCNYLFNGLERGKIRYEVLDPDGLEVIRMMVREQWKTLDFTKYATKVREVLNLVIYAVRHKDKSLLSSAELKEAENSSRNLIHKLFQVHGEDPSDRILYLLSLPFFDKYRMPPPDAFEAVDADIVRPTKPLAIPSFKKL